MSDRAKHERTITAGLLQDPRRLVELTGFTAQWFKTPEYRLAFHLARKYHDACVADGKIRYAGTEVVIREADQWVRVAADKAKRKSRASSKAALVDFAEESKSQDEFVDDHAFRDAADRLRECVADDVGSDGIVSIAEDLRKHGPRGLSNRLMRLSAEVSAVGTHAAMVGEIDADAASVYTDYVKAKRSPTRGRIDTPWQQLNDATEGGRRGRMWIVAAYAKDGKSQCMKDLLYHAATQGRGVFLVSGEQAREDLRDMMTVRHSHKFVPGGLPYKGVTRGTLDASQERVLRRTVKDLSSGDFNIGYFRAPSGTTIRQVRAVAEARNRSRRVDVIGIDHSDLFESDHSYRSDRERLAAVLKDCKDLSLEFDNARGAWVVVCHQISRDGYEQAVKRGYYLPSDMGGSAEAERSCDVMVWALRTDDMKEAREIRLGVGIDRRGAGHPRGWVCYERFESAAVLPLDP